MLPVLLGAAESLTLRSGLAVLQRAATPALTKAVERGIILAESYKTGANVFEFIEEAESNRDPRRRRSEPRATDLWPARTVIAAYATATATFLRRAADLKTAPALLGTLTPPSLAQWSSMLLTTLEPISSLLREDLLIDWTDPATIRAAFFKVVHHAVQQDSQPVIELVQRIIEDEKFPLPDHMIAWLPQEYLLDKRFISLIASIANVPSKQRVAMQYVLADAATHAPEEISNADFEAPQFYAALKLALGPNQFMPLEASSAPLSQMPIPSAFQQATVYSRPPYLRAPVFLQADPKLESNQGIFVPGSDTPFPTKDDINKYINSKTTETGGRTTYEIPKDYSRFFNLQ